MSQDHSAGGVLTALGISTLLLHEPHFLLALKLAGALYLLWVAKKAIKALSVPPHATSPAPVANYYWQGLSLHLTDPKAILIGLTVTSIGVSTHSTPWTTLLLVMLCAILGIIIFSLYAFRFSTETAQGILSRYHRLINLFCAGFYTLVAIGFLVSLFT
ncbi:LysE family transporter [Rosenbergiella collisarenosi]|uniref:LysE family transporter n=1 Tax=Rosenbergiella collisarenosi TaxID=1544695 RepID=UPI001F4F766C|nr:LysE family transporter [Rosenbergiella collisarenosi]